MDEAAWSCYSQGSWTWPGPAGVQGGGRYLRHMLVENSVKDEGLLPGSVCAQRVLGVLSGVHEHHHLGTGREGRGQGLGLASLRGSDSGLL